MVQNKEIKMTYLFSLSGAFQAVFGFGMWRMYVMEETFNFMDRGSMAILRVNWRCEDIFKSQLTP